MLYALLASLGAGGISVFVLLWRLSVAQAQRDKARADESRWKAELDREKATLADQLSRRDQEIEVLQRQRKEALDAMENFSCPGSLRNALRVSLGLETAGAPEPEPTADRRT